MCNSLWPHGPQHPRFPCPSSTPKAYSNSCPLSWWCRPTISSSIIPSPPPSRLQSSSAFFQMSQFFTSGDQSIGVLASTSILPMNSQDWFPLGLTGLILQSKGLSRVFSNTTVQKHQSLGAELSLYFWIIYYLTDVLQFSYLSISWLTLASAFWILWIILLWTLLCKFLYGHWFIGLLRICLAV